MYIYKKLAEQKTDRWRFLEQQRDKETQRARESERLREGERGSERERETDKTAVSLENGRFLNPKPASFKL